MYRATVNQQKQLSFSKEALLSELLLRSGEYIAMPCGGNGTCGKCKVIAKGKLSPLTEKEKEALTQKEREQGFRLACVAKALGDVEIFATAVSPNVATDYSREAVPRTFDRTNGLVIDIGTTTVAAVLYQNKQPINIITEANRQAVYGADVISRIQREKDIPGVLGNLLKQQIKDIITQCGTPENIVIAANTIMLHFLTDLPVLPLGEAPYRTASLFGTEVPLFGTNCYLSPCVSAFVGGDITTGILASRMEETKESAMLVDLGTNGEIAYFDGQQFYTASTAAGPAFEGQGIFHGMAAEPGAIDHVFLKDGIISFSTVGNTVARGICGSGLVDVLAVMLQCGALEESGSLNPHHPFCKKDHHGKICFAIPKSDVIIRASDIRKLQLAKSAIHAGILTLAQKAATLYLAGGFGSYLDIENAMFIGLLPKDFFEKTHSLGNAALAGGKLLLFSDRERESIRKLSNLCKSVELSTNPVFTENYIEKMLFD